jgi:hypothetical protein
MANHSSMRTMQLYDERSVEIFGMGFVQTSTGVSEKEAIEKNGRNNQN